MKIIVNGKERELDVEPDMPLLWVLRDELREYGVKFGCGIAQCGACTVHLNGAAVRSCSVPIVACEGQAVDTLEALGTPESMHAVQEAWVENQVAQCGYCQPGQMMTAASFLAQNNNPNKYNRPCRPTFVVVELISELRRPSMMLLKKCESPNESSRYNHTKSFYGFISHYCWWICFRILEL